MNADLSWDMWGLETSLYGSLECGYNQLDISKMRFQIQCPKCGRLYGIRRAETSRIADIFNEDENAILSCPLYRGGCGLKSEINIDDVIDTHAKTTNTKW